MLPFPPPPSFMDGPSIPPKPPPQRPTFGSTQQQTALEAHPTHPWPAGAPAWGRRAMR